MQKFRGFCNVYRKITKYRYRTDNKAPEILIFNLLFTNQSSNVFIGAILISSTVTLLLSFFSSKIHTVLIRYVTNQARRCF